MQSSRDLALLVLLSFALPGGLVAQEPAPQAAFGERVDVEVVNVDVVVTDRSGRRVTDLEKSDFELRVDGEPVAIEYFAAPERVPRPIAPRQVAPLTPAPRALPERGPPPSTFVFFVDQSALERQVRQRTLLELRGYLDRAMEGDRQVLVAAFQDDLRLLAAPTADRGTVETALDALEKLPLRGSVTAAERTQLEHEIRNFGRAVPMVRSEIDPDGDVQREINRSQNERLRIQTEIELWADKELDRQTRSIRALQQIVEALSSVDGRKSVILATAGYSSEPGAFLLRFFAQKLGLPQNSLLLQTPRLVERGVELSESFERLVASAQDARVAIYTVSPREAPSPQASAEFESAGAGTGAVAPPPRDTAAIDAGSSLARLASATGGRRMFVDEELSEELEQVAADADAIYSLGFTTGPEAGTKAHRLEVRVARSSVEVRCRESFRRTRGNGRAAASLASTATLGAEHNPFGITLELGAPVPGASRRELARVPFAVRIPLGAVALLPRGAAREGSLLVQVAVRDAAGKFFFDAGTPIAISVPEAELERALAGVWVHRAEIAVAPGSQRIAVMVRDEQGHDYSTTSAEVEVP